MKLKNNYFILVILFMTLFFSKNVKALDGKNEYSKIYSPSISNQYGDVVFSFKYDETTGNYLATNFKFTESNEKINFIFDSIDCFKNKILDKALNDEWPSDIYCGTIRSSLILKSNYSIILGNESVTDGDMVCSFNKNLFNDVANKLVRYNNPGGFLITASVCNSSSEIVENSSCEIKDNKYYCKNAQVCSEALYNEECVSSSNDSNDDGKIEISDITLGQVCKSENLKVPLKYVGWLISALKVVIPIVIIAFGVMDLLKAIASQKPEELSKAIKTVMIRIIAGVVIFFIPMIIDFLFTLIDDWTNYVDAYSECVTCLFDPKNC